MSFATPLMRASASMEPPPARPLALRLRPSRCDTRSSAASVASISRLSSSTGASPSSFVSAATFCFRPWCSHHSRYVAVGVDGFILMSCWSIAKFWRTCRHAAQLAACVDRASSVTSARA